MSSVGKPVIMTVVATQTWAPLSASSLPLRDVRMVFVAGGQGSAMIRPVGSSATNVAIAGDIRSIAANGVLEFDRLDLSLVEVATTGEDNYLVQITGRAGGND